MLNQYPLWKYLLIALALVVSTIYALPNLYGEDPAIQVTSSRNVDVDSQTLEQVKGLLDGKGIKYQSINLSDGRLMVRFPDTETQLEAKDLVKEKLGRGYVVALNLAPKTPHWLVALEASPMDLGLDLRGGVHFLMEVDVNSAVKQAEERYISDFRGLLREAKVRYSKIERWTDETGKSGVELGFKSQAELDKAQQVIGKEYGDLQLRAEQREGDYILLASLSEKERREVRKLALKQNITTLRSR